MKNALSEFAKDELDELKKLYADCTQVVEDGNKELRKYFKERTKKKK